MTACAGGSEEESRLRLVSFDVSLAFGEVEETSGRVGPIVDALNAETADVICLQGLWPGAETGSWSDARIEDILAGTAQTYPHSHWERTRVPQDAATSGCEIEEITTLDACTRPACGDLAPDGLVACVLGSCAAEAVATSSSCQACLFASIGQPYDEVVESCSGVSSSIRHDGHNGLAILSRHPIVDSDHHPLQFAQVARSVLRAEVDTEPLVPATSVRAGAAHHRRGPHC